MMTHKNVSPHLDDKVFRALIASLSQLGRGGCSNFKPGLAEKLNFPKIVFLGDAEVPIANVAPTSTTSN